MPTTGRAPTSTSGRHGRKTSSQTAAEYQQHRRDKTKSSPSYVQRPQREPTSNQGNTAADGHPTQVQRPLYKSRAHSAPHVPKDELPAPKGGSAADRDEDYEDPSEDEEEIADDPFFQRYDMPQSDGEQLKLHTNYKEGPEDTEGPLSPTSNVTRMRPDSTADPLGSPLSPRSPASWPENSARLQEINIVVLGSPTVGKSAFIQKAFNLQSPPMSAISSRKMSIDGHVYVVRLIELPFSELDLDNESRICWPDTAMGQPIPYIDGAFTLYDVMNRESLVQVPETLSGIYNASIPFILVACKCDFPSTHRHVDPTGVEKRAKALIGDITAFQTSKAQPDSQKRCVAVLLRAIVSMRNQHIALAAAARRRANSSAVRRVSPQSSSFKHNRAASEFSTTSTSRSHQSANYRASSPGRLTTKSKSAQNLPIFNQNHHQGFSQESGYLSDDPEQESSEEDERQHEMGNDKPLPTPYEVGYSFDQLVDKLLAQPMTKNDQKFAAIFLALYRKFAAPGQLLDAIIDRFDMLRAQQIPPMTKMAAQQRHLSILEQWIGMYPGDFAYSKTKRTMENFVYRVSSERIFAVDAREIAADLGVVAEDDDTHWACCDADRDRKKYDSGNGMPKSIAALSVLDDLPSGLPCLRQVGSVSSASTSQTLLNVVENAQRQAKSLVPQCRVSLSKVQWHAFMEQPDEAVARELTRMDNIMFTSIRPRDLVRYVSLNAEQKKRCRNLENVHRMIEHFNYIADWVISFVLLRDKPKHRAYMLEKFYKIARELRKLNNYNSLAAVVSGINNSAVYRLQATKDLVPPESGKDFKRLEVLMSQQKSYAAYRLAWENTSGERIPYLPLHKRDLVSAEEGNRTLVGNESEGEGDVRINWKKFEIMGEVIVSMQKAQGMPYAPFKASDDIRCLITEVEVVRDEDVSYDRSCHVEPAGGAKKRFQWFPGAIANS